jgi:hypothetical protein
VSQAPTTITLDVLEESTCKIRRHTLQPDAEGRVTVALQAAPGATALEFVLREADGQIVPAAEAPVQPR